MVSLTDNEYEIVNLMWNQGRALSRTEIIVLLPDKAWSASSIHILLNKLLEKNAIKVDGFVKTGKNYGRTYTAAITRDEYTVMQLKQSTGRKSNEPLTFPAIFAALINDKEINIHTISELEEMIENKKKELEK